MPASYWLVALAGPQIKGVYRMSNYSEFEDEVLMQSKKYRFDGNVLFVGLITPDAVLNNNYSLILFNTLMHKIISFKQSCFLSYQAYEACFAEHVKEEFTSIQRKFYYDFELVLIMEKELHEGVIRDIFIPCDKAIIDEDALIIKKLRARNERKK